MASNDTGLNAVVGAVVTVVLAFLPFSPVLGGGVAGYLEGPDRGRGLRVGAIAGLVACIPLVVFFGLFSSFIPFVPASWLVLTSVLLLFALAFFVLYTVALSALGGYLGAYLKAEL